MSVEQSHQLHSDKLNLANHLDGVSHDRINRYLRGEKLTPRLLWDNVALLMQPSENAYVLDDTVLDKRYSGAIETARGGSTVATNTE